MTNQLYSSILNSNRLHYLDNLKVFLTILVILHHIAIAFGGDGHFIIHVSGSNTLSELMLTAFLAINQSYFMGIFFATSAFFSYKSLIRKKKKSFIMGKIKRLLLPAIIYFFLINPILSWTIDTFYLKLPPEEIRYKTGFGALWFIVALFMFDIIYACFFHREKREFKPIPSFKISLLFAINIAVVTWLVRIVFKVGDGIEILDFQPGHFPQYIFAYYIGIVSSKYNWPHYLNANKHKKKIFIAFVSIILLFIGIAITLIIYKDIIYALGGLNSISLLYCIWEQVMFITLVFGLVSLFKDYFNKSNKMMKILSQTAYLTYIIHSAIIALVVMCLSKLNLSYNLSLLLVVCFSVIFSFACATGLKKIF